MGVELEKSALESAVLQYTSVETDGGDALRPKAESRKIVVRSVLRFVLWGLISVVALGGALFGYFVYSPAPEVPRLSGTLTKGTIEVGGLKRTYLTYVPRGLAKGAPLVMVMHGSDENGARIRIETGYGFERLADERGFAVVYPDGYEGYWNACNIVGDYSANKLNIDDVGFLTGSSTRSSLKSVSIGTTCLRPAFPVAVIWRFVLRSKLLPAFAQLRR
jgi:nitrate reductase NapE component